MAGFLKKKGHTIDVSVKQSHHGYKTSVLSYSVFYLTKIHIVIDKIKPLFDIELGGVKTPQPTGASLKAKVLPRTLKCHPVVIIFPDGLNISCSFITSSKFDLSAIIR